MKQKSIITIFFLAFLLMDALKVEAQSPVGSGDWVPLGVEKIKDTELGNGYPKAPVQPPYVTLDDHTLYIWSQHGGYTLTLLDDNDAVVYQTYVAAGVQFCALPSTLSGSYTLQLSNDTYLFTGIISL